MGGPVLPCLLRADAHSHVELRRRSLRGGSRVWAHSVGANLSPPDCLRLSGAALRRTPSALALRLSLPPPLRRTFPCMRGTYLSHLQVESPSAHSEPRWQRCDVGVADMPQMSHGFVSPGNGLLHLKSPPLLLCPATCNGGTEQRDGLYHEALPSRNGVLSVSPADICVRQNSRCCGAQSPPVAFSPKPPWPGALGPGLLEGAPGPARPPVEPRSSLPLFICHGPPGSGSCPGACGCERSPMQIWCGLCLGTTALTLASQVCPLRDSPEFAFSADPHISRRLFSSKNLDSRCEKFGLLF